MNAMIVKAVNYFKRNHIHSRIYHLDTGNSANEFEIPANSPKMLRRQGLKSVKLIKKLKVPQVTDGK